MDSFLKIILAILSNFTSRKLWATVIGVGLLYTVFWHSVNFLYTFDQDFKVAAFSSMFDKVVYGIIAIIASYLGINGLVQMKSTSENIVTQAVSSVFEKRESKNIDVQIVDEMRSKPDFEIE